MPSILQNSKELEKRFLNGAPQYNRSKIQNVINIYKERSGVPFRTVQNMVIALFSPSVFGPKGKEKVENMYENYVSKFQNGKTYPINYMRTARQIDKLEDKRDRLLGKKHKYTLRVILLTQEQKSDPSKDRPPQDIIKSYRKKSHKGLVQYWSGDLSVQAYRSTVFEQQLNKLTLRDTREFKQLYPICMTDQYFADREMKAPGYLEAIYLLKWTADSSLKRGAESGQDPRTSKKRASNKVAIQYKYCTTQVDLSKKTFRDSLQKSNHKQDECWLNAITENYEKTILNPEKTKNRVTRETILNILGRTEEDIKDGLTINEVLPFFQTYKLKLRVFDVFYNLIFKYEPEVPNFNNRPFYCVTDGNHIYTLNKDLESLAQKANADEYNVSASSNFHIPEKPENANYRVIDHIDEILDILREAPEEDRIIYIVQKQDNLEAIVWQLYEAGYRPNIKYGAGRLTWLSLAIKKTTFVIKTQQMIDYAIDGMMEIDNATVFNRMHDAKTDFQYRLFKSEHRSYYTQQDIEILDECRTIANVGWMNTLNKCSRVKKHVAPSLRRSDLIEIDISKAYTGAFIRITAIPVFTEFDIWQPYNSNDKIHDLSLYLVEAKEVDLYFNKRYNLCYGQFLKQLKNVVCDIYDDILKSADKKQDSHFLEKYNNLQGRSMMQNKTDTISDKGGNMTNNSYKIHAVKHPGIIKKVDYKQMI